MSAHSNLSQPSLPEQSFNEAYFAFEGLDGAIFPEFQEIDWYLDAARKSIDRFLESRGQNLSQDIPIDQENSDTTQSKSPNSDNVQEEPTQKQPVRRTRLGMLKPKRSRKVKQNRKKTRPQKMPKAGSWAESEYYRSVNGHSKQQQERGEARREDVFYTSHAQVVQPQQQEQQQHHYFQQLLLVEEEVRQQEEEYNRFQQQQQHTIPASYDHTHMRFDMGSRAPSSPHDFMDVHRVSMRSRGTLIPPIDSPETRAHFYPYDPALFLVEG